MKSCHAILLFVNIDVRTDASDSILKNRHDELDLLLTELRKLSADGNTIGRPLALLLTKWDVLGPITDDAKRERQRAWDYLRSRPALKQIADTLKNCGDRVELFPVSAFGGHREGNKPPAGGPRSSGLHAPLLWAAERADEMLIEGARRRADELASPRRWWWWRRYGKAVKCYRQLIDGDGLNKGPLHTEAEQALNHWRSKRFRRRMWLGVTTVVVFSMFAFGLLWWRDRSDYEKTLAGLQDHSLSPERMRQDSEVYLGGWNPLSRWLGHRDEIREKWNAYHKGREDQEFSELESYRRDHSGEEDADQRLSRDEGFLNRWAGSVRGATVEGWKKHDASCRDEFKRNQRFDAEYHGLLERLSKLVRKYDQLMAQCSGFLKQFPRDQYPKKDSLLRDVEGKRESYEVAKKEQDWADVVSYELQNPSNFDEIINKAKAYAIKPDAGHSKEAYDLIDRTQTRWDQADYEKVRSATRDARDAASIEAASRVARDYLDAGHKKAAEGEVKRWLTWREGFAAEKEYYFTIKSISIPEGSKLDRGNNNTKVYVKFGERTVDTGWGYPGNNPQVDKQLGPIRFKWGEPSDLEVTVEKDDWYPPPFKNDKATGMSENNKFLLGKVNGPFRVTRAKGKEVEVQLECPEAVPPSLPP